MSRPRTGIYAGLPTYPAGWGEAPLSDLVDINPETLGTGTPGDFKFRYIDLSSVDRGVIHWDTVQEMTFRTAPSRARRVVREGDTLFGTVRPSLQSHAHLGSADGGPLVGSTGFAVLRAGSKTCPGFIRHLIFSEQVTDQVRRLETGSNYPAVNESDLSGVLVPHPPVEEQARIAEVLDTLDKAIQGTESVILKLKASSQGLRRDLLTRGISLDGEIRLSRIDAPDIYQLTPMGWIPKEWGLSTVGDQFEIQLGKMLDAEKSSGELRPYIGNKAVQWDKIDISDVQFVALRKEEMMRFRLKAGDLLVCEGGEVGRAAIWNEPIPECYYQKALHRLRPRDRYFSSLMLEFLRHWTNQDLLSEYVSKTSIAHLTQEKLSSIPLPVPPEVEQNSIINAFEQSKKRQEVEEAHLAKLYALKSGLTSDLLTGCVRTPVGASAC